MDALNMVYRLKEGFYPPDQYPGSNVENLQLEDGRVFCSTKYVEYLKRKIDSVNNVLGVDKAELNNYGDRNRPYSSSFRP